MSKFRWALAPAIAALVLFGVACGGDDDDGDTTGASTTTSTTSASTSTDAAATTGSTSAATGATGTTTGATGTVTRLGSGGETLDVGGFGSSLESVESMRFNTRVSFDFDGATGSSAGDAGTALVEALLGNIQVEGEYVAPDRFHATTQIFGTEMQVITIGGQTWSNDGSGWTEGLDGAELPIDLGGTGGVPFEDLPRVELAGAETSEEEVNGQDTTRYTFDKEAITALLESDSSMGDLSDLEEIESMELSFWVTDEGVPVKMMVNAAGETEGSAFSMIVEYNVTDINDDSLSIEPPL